jgi:hypothetical protein
MRLFNISTAVIALACLASSAVFAQPKTATPAPKPSPKMVKMGKMKKPGKMTKTVETGKVKTGKMTRTAPARDPKTGRFLKKETPKVGATAKKMPARDPKTGRFISSKPKAAAPAPK